MSLIDDLLNDDVSAATVAMKTQGGAYGATDTSGTWQTQLLGIGTNYINGLAQIDLARRVSQVPAIISKQAPIETDVTTRAVASVGSVRLGNMLPLILLGLGVYVLLGKGR